MFTGIRTICIPVLDYERAVDFYVRCLELEIVQDIKLGPDFRLVEVRTQDPSSTTICLVPPLPDTFEPGRLTGLVLQCEDVREVYEKLTRRGVTFVQPPTPHPLADFATFMDSEGNQILVVSRRKE